MVASSEALPGQSQTVVVHTLLWLVIYITVVIEKRPFIPGFGEVLFPWHYLNWSFPRPDLKKEKSASFRTGGVHAAPSVFVMNVHQWIVLDLKIWLTLSKFIHECFGVSTSLASCCQWLLLLIGSPCNSFVSSSGWVSSFYLISFLKERQERRQVFNRLLPTPLSSIVSQVFGLDEFIFTPLDNFTSLHVCMIEPSCTMLLYIVPVLDDKSSRGFVKADRFPS